MANESLLSAAASNLKQVYQRKSAQNPASMASCSVER